MTDPLPRRIAWFAPWTWRRRTLAVIALLVGYVLSPIPVLWVAERFGSRDAFDSLASTFYLPLGMASKAIKPLDDFYEMQRDWLCRIIGEP